MRHLLSGSTLLALALASASASANVGGLAGYSGKPTAAAPAGESCNKCHAGGTAPTVTILGPATLAAGQKGDYTLEVTTGVTRAAGGIAATDGVALTTGAGTGLRPSFNELVPDGERMVAGGKATFTFSVTAPATGATLKLWAVGLASNNNNVASGDRAAHVVRDIAVTGGTPPVPDAGTPVADASAPAADGGDAGSSGTSGGTSGTSGGTSGTSGGTSGTSGGTSGTSGGTSGTSGGTSGTSGTSSDPDADGDARDGDSASCSSSPASPSGNAGAAGGGAVLAVIAMAGLVASARRRSRSA